MAGEEDKKKMQAESEVEVKGDEPQARKASKQKKRSHKKAKTEVAAEAEATTEKAAEALPQVEVLENRLLRLQADFDNFRKRALREKEELWTRAHADVIEELLPVLDHMDLALEAAEKHGAPDAFVEGFQLVRGQMGTTLKKFGLTPQEVQGQEFDPNLHEAVAHMPSAAAAENHIVAQARRGYMFNDKLLRPAQVVVSSGAPDENSSGES